jgi:hypothetical protein
MYADALHNMMFSVFETVTVQGTGEMGINAVLTGLALLGLIAVFILKLINVIRAATWYEYEHIFSTFAVAVICFFFVRLGSLMNVESVTFASYVWFSWPLMIIIGFLWVAELFMLPVNTSIRLRFNPSEKK